MVNRRPNSTLGVYYDRPHNFEDKDKNRYTCLQYIARGGFGKVYKVGKNGNSDRIFCGKFVEKSSGKLKNHNTLEEVRIHAELHHENVIRLTRCVDHGKFYCLILEFCENKSLATLIKRRVGLTEPEISYFGRQIVAGLQYLYAKRVIHRDMKPQNILLDGHMTAKIADFGLAMPLTNRRMKAKKLRPLGTPCYMAPEMVDDRVSEYDHMVDVWAFGCILFSMFEGYPPFYGSDTRRIYRDIVAGIYTIPVGMSKSLGGLVERLLRTDPSRRLQLDRILQHEFFKVTVTPRRLPRSVQADAPMVIAPQHGPDHLAADRRIHEAAVISRIVSKAPLGPSPLNVVVENRNDRQQHTDDVVVVVANRYCSGNCVRNQLRQFLNDLIDVSADNKRLTTWKESELESPCLEPVIWVKEFIDCTELSQQQCVAFRFNNGVVGALYNDGTAVNLLRDDNIQFYSPILRPSKYVWKRQQCPVVLRNRIGCLRNLYRDSGGGGADSEDGGIDFDEIDSRQFISTVPNLVFFKNNPEYSLMILSSGLIQIADKKFNTQILACSRLKSITFAPPKNGRQTAGGSASVTYGMHDLKRHGQPFDIAQLLQKANQTIYNLADHHLCFICGQTILKKK